MKADLEQMPESMKELAVSAGPSSTRGGQGQKTARRNGLCTTPSGGAAADELATQIKAVLQEGKELTIKLDLDRKNAEGVFSVRFTGKPGTKLAATISESAENKSIVANLGPPVPHSPAASSPSYPGGCESPSTPWWTKG